MSTDLFVSLGVLITCLGLITSTFHSSKEDE